MPRPRKRRKIEREDRTTRYLDLTSDTAQSDYDRRDSIETLVKALRKRRKIVVIAGAGISVSAGIPDFRSSNGLFASLKGEHKLKGGSGKQLFDASVYKDNTLTGQFHDMLRDLSGKCSTAQPTKFHYMLARLAREERLLRVYTQNIDGLETRFEQLQTDAPLPHKGPWPKTVQLHGGLDKMYCQKCRQIFEFEAMLFEGEETPTCHKCRETDDIRTNELGRRSHGIGRLRPRIVLYNEENEDRDAIGAVSVADTKTRPDAVVVVGTSMKIPGVRRLVAQFTKIVRDRVEGTTIWINPDPEPKGYEFENSWDLIVKGTSDDVADLVRLRNLDDPIIDDESVALEYSDGEYEKLIKERGQVKVNIPPSLTKIKTVNVMTPPRSQTGDSSQYMKRTIKESPIRIKLLVGEQSQKAEERKQQIQINVPKMKNPASGGRKLNDVLGKETVSKSRQPMTTNPTKSRSRKEKANDLEQSKLAGNITKVSSQAPVKILGKGLQDESHKSKIHMNGQVSGKQLLHEIESRQMPTPAETSQSNTPKMSVSPDPGAGLAVMYGWTEDQMGSRHVLDKDNAGHNLFDTLSDRRQTISPKGGLPRGMENLID